MFAISFILLTISYAFNLVPFFTGSAERDKHISCTPERHVCVMKTLFDLEDDPGLIKPISEADLPAEVKSSINASLSWIAKAQLQDGGWGAGMHARQDVRDPHMVTADPATTSLVALAMLRTGSSLSEGTYKKEVTKATEFLLKAVEQWPEDQPRLTTLNGRYCYRMQ